MWLGHAIEEEGEKVAGGAEKMRATLEREVEALQGYVKGENRT